MKDIKTMSDEEKDSIARQLNHGWRKYVEFFELAPRGTYKQLRAMLEFSCEPDAGKEVSIESDIQRKTTVTATPASGEQVPLAEMPSCVPPTVFPPLSHASADC